VFWASGLGALAIFTLHLAEGWNQPWVANPDQDLVFLRDGLRLASLQKPGYSDHPGLVQMLIGAIAHLLLNSPGLEVLDDQHWQQIFRLHKMLNGFSMALLIAISSTLVGQLTRPRSGLVWGLMCALGLGSTVLTYQLRNEFFSAFCFYIAALMLWTQLRRPAPLSMGWLLSMHGLLYLSLLAKVQVFPLLLLLNGGLLIWLLRSASVEAAAMLQAGAWLAAASAVAGLLIQQPAPTLGSWATATSVLVLAGSPGVGVTLATARAQPGHSPHWTTTAAAFGVTSLAYGAVVQHFHWQAISWNPYSMGRHRIDMGGHCDWACYGARAGDAISGLFERSFDGLVIAQLLSLVVPVMLLLTWLQPTRGGSNRPSEARGVSHPSRAATTLIGSALLMSVVASWRWPVDHYLPYQQPLLFLGLLMAADDLKPQLFWRGLVIYAALSLVLINLRYPEQARSTFQKYNPQALLERRANAGPISDRDPICWQQHAGKEWDGSILQRICQWPITP
jgi:hypothetical protein